MKEITIRFEKESDYNEFISDVLCLYNTDKLREGVSFDKDTNVVTIRDIHVKN